MRDKEVIEVVLKDGYHQEDAEGDEEADVGEE